MVKLLTVLSVEEIQKTQKQFVDAAKRDGKYGLDGIELHGAHGHLIVQFMSPILKIKIIKFI